MPNYTIMKIIGAALLAVVAVVLLFHFLPVVVGLLALIGLADLIIVLRRHW